MPQNESGVKCKPEMSNKELELLWQKKKKNAGRSLMKRTRTQHNLPVTMQDDIVLFRLFITFKNMLLRLAVTV